MDVFITGGTGYVGKFLISSLIEKKDIKTIRLLVRNIENAKLQLQSLLQKANLNGKNVVMLEGDVTNQSLSNSEIIDIDSINEVYHLASIVSLSNDKSKREGIINTNFGGTKNILEFFKNSKNLKKLFYFSTAYVCGKTSMVVKEQWLDKPTSFRNHYEESKWLSEKLIEDYHKKYGINYVIFRPGIISGSDIKNLEELRNSTFYKYGHTLYQAFKLQNGSKSKIRLVGSKLSTLNIIPIEHVIKLIMEIRSSNESKKIFNLTNETNCLCNSVIEGVQAGLEFNDGYEFENNLTFELLSNSEKLAYQFTKSFWEYTLGNNIEWSIDNTKEIRKRLGLLPINNEWLRNHLKIYFKQVENLEKEKLNLQI